MHPNGQVFAAHKNCESVRARPSGAPRTGHSGLVTVLVARDRGGSTAGVCFYLVDTWCLGVKDAAGPRPVDRWRLGGFIQ